MALVLLHSIIFIDVWDYMGENEKGLSAAGEAFGDKIAIYMAMYLMYHSYSCLFAGRQTQQITRV